MNRINRLAVATGALTLALTMGMASANEKDRGPTSSSTPPAPTSMPPSTSSTPPNTSYGTSRTTAPSDTTTTSAPSSMETDTSTSLSSNGRAVGRPFAQFNDLDTNFDGTISADELSANTSVSIDLAMYDSNKDGKLSESEYARYKNQMARNKSVDEPKQR